MRCINLLRSAISTGFSCFLPLREDVVRTDGVSRFAFSECMRRWLEVYSAGVSLATRVHQCQFTNDLQQRRAEIRTSNDVLSLLRRKYKLPVQNLKYCDYFVVNEKYFPCNDESAINAVQHGITLPLRPSLTCSTDGEDAGRQYKPFYLASRCLRHW
jgi:hypothetical protein